MKAKRTFNDVTQQFEAYMIPAGYENPLEGIQIRIFQLTVDDLIEINSKLNELLTLEIERTQTPPSVDTIANVLRKIIIKQVKKIEENKNGSFK